MVEGAHKQKDDPRSANAIDKRIGQKIRARRLELGMSQERLADEIGVSFQQIQKYEKGVNRVSARTLLEIAHHLDVSITTLVSSKARPEVDLDDPGVAQLAAAWRKLNAAGRASLLDKAKALATDPKMRS